MTKRGALLHGARERFEEIGLGVLAAMLEAASDQRLGWVCSASDIEIIAWICGADA